MKTIFLDFDGVLNSQGYIERSLRNNLNYKIDGHLGLDSIAIQRLNRLVEVEYNFVISSTWRMGYKKPLLKQLLADRGFIGEIIGTTPILPTGHRGSEIKQWLDRWSGDPVTAFFILDDNADMDPYMDRLIQTEFENGLQDSHIDAILNEHI